jgi:hypothetical protein
MTIGWRDRRAQRRAARAAVRSLDSLHRLVADGAGTVSHAWRRLVLRWRDPAAALTEQISAIAESRAELAGFYDPAVEELAQQWGQALTEAIVLTAAADAQRRGEPVPVRSREPSVDDRRWDSTDRQLQLASALNMLRSVGLESCEKPWPVGRIGQAVAGMASGP